MYRGPLNGLLVMMKTDGLRAVQAGLAPAMMYQFVMNGLRLGSYAMLEAGGVVRDSRGQLSLARCTLCSAASGLDLLSSHQSDRIIWGKLWIYFEAFAAIQLKT